MTSVFSDGGVIALFYGFFCACQTAIRGINEAFDDGTSGRIPQE